MIKIPKSWILINWEELKLRSGILDYLGKIDQEKECFPFKVDGPLIYYSTLTKAYSGENNSDTKDFYDNYKTFIDSSPPHIEDRSDDGLIITYPSPKPRNTITVFTGAGDDTSTTDLSGIGNGQRVCFSMPASGESLSIDLEFQEDIYIKDGLILSKNAPFGACVDMDIHHPVAGKVVNFLNKVPIYGDFPIHLDSEDRALISKGLKIRITLYNSNPNIYPSHDPPSAFKACGRFEIYRSHNF